MTTIYSTKDRRFPGWQLDTLAGATMANMEMLTVELADLKKRLEQIALVNCTCDYELDINPAVHDLYCMYRVMTGYQSETEQGQWAQ